MSVISDKWLKSLLINLYLLYNAHEKRGKQMIEKLKNEIYELISNINSEKKLKLILQFIRGIKSS